MGLYKGSKLFFDFFKKCISKITLNDTIKHSIPKINLNNPSLSSVNNAKNWFKNPRNIFYVTVLGGGVVITVHYGNWETIPFTKRTHFMLLPWRIEETMADLKFEVIKKRYKGKILPEIHPDSIRVRLIAKEIVEALQRVLLEDDTLTVLSDGAEGHWSKEDEILHDKWVQQSRKKGPKRGVKPSISHLERLNWEILVVDKPVVNAFCLSGGKIVLFTGLLRHFQTNEEIATLIGHEVGHVVARHELERITKLLWFVIKQLLLLVLVMPHLLRRPFWRRSYSRNADMDKETLLMWIIISDHIINMSMQGMELEADYIGLLLLASAGYDPRVAPMVYEKSDKITGSLPMVGYLSTHPSGKKRAKLLAQAKVMEEALSIYLQPSFR